MEMTNPLLPPRSSGRSWRRRGAAAGLCSAVALAGLAAPAAPTGAVASAAAEAAPRHLDLGPADLPESRTTRTLQRGVTLTRITRGTHDASLRWTEEMLIPSSETSPDPDAPPRSLSDRASARAEAARLADKGFDARVEPVRQPRMADVEAGILGYRVRVGSFATQEEADAEKARLAAAGETASTVYTGWDGRRTDRGPWRVNVLRIDPRRFTGRLAGSFGPDLFQRETTSQLALLGGATAAVNGGYFVLDPAAGAPGDPAGAGVYAGRVLSESIDGRPALILHSGARHSSIVRMRWAGRMRVGGTATPLDGVNRVPGLIRNCGGDPTDEPTSQPLHDFTCTDDAELVAFTPQYAERTPEGTGREVVVDHGVVSAVSESRGTTLTPRSAVGPGHRERHRPARGRPGGRPAPAPAAAADPGRTTPHAARDDRHQRWPAPDAERTDPRHPAPATGSCARATRASPTASSSSATPARSPASTGGAGPSSSPSTAAPPTTSASRFSSPPGSPARSGLVDAINLDGGGSTTMVVDGAVISHPSDTTGERPVGDALLIGRR